jgi:hypothetical protein
MTANANHATNIDTIIKMAERLIEALQADIDVLEAGHPREMKSLDPLIQQLYAQYAQEAGKLSPETISALPAGERARLTDSTRRFREILSLHTRILTRIRTASEGMIKAVAEEVEKRRGRTRPYAPASGAKPKTARPASSSLIYNAVV